MEHLGDFGNGEGLAQMIRHVVHDLADIGILRNRLLLRDGQRRSSLRRGRGGTGGKTLHHVGDVSSP